MRRLLFGLGLTLACAAPALAGPTVRGTCSVGAVTTCVLSSTPNNGDVVAFAVADANLTAFTVKDSNSVALTLHDICSTGTTSPCSAVWDYTVSGSPTATYTMSSAPTIWGGVDLSNAAGTSQYGAGQGTSGTSVNTGLVIGNGDLQLCALGTGAASSGTSLTFSNNNAGSVSLGSTAHNVLEYTSSTGSGSSTCTGNWTTSAGNALVYADYSSGLSTPAPARGWIGGYERPPLFTWPS